MKKLKLVLFFLLGCFSTSLKAQDIFFSNYPQHQYFYNPAFAGVDSSHNFSLSGRAKSTMQGHGYTTLLSYNQSLCNFKSGIGGIVAFQQEDYFHRYQIGTSYNYKFKIAPKMNLRIGLNATTEFYHQNEIKSWFNGQTIPAIDATIFDAGAGLEYDWRNFYFGFSMKHLLPQNKLLHQNIDVIYPAKFIMAGNKFNLSKSFSTSPSMLLIYQGPNQYFQFANDVSLYKTYLLGVGVTGGYNRLDKLIFKGGISLKNKFQMMLSYDSIELGRLVEASGSNGTYEATLQYRF